MFNSRPRRWHYGAVAGAEAVSMTLCLEFAAISAGFCGFDLLASLCCKADKITFIVFGSMIFFFLFLDLD